MRANEELGILLKKYQPGFHAIVPFTPGRDTLLRLHLTAQNKELHSGIFEDTPLFCAWINQQLNTAGARYGIGGYGEHRTVYSASRVFDGAVPGEEPRRLHLGTDIWGKPHTAVMAPIDGIVHSFAFNDRKGDYGATIILTHTLEGKHFYTLYGHLSLNSLKNLQEGERIEAGQVFAELGIPSENGQWPPHLHFQLIRDIGDARGDYPGVCRYSEKERWMDNCPDPDLLLQLNQYLPA